MTPTAGMGTNRAQAQKAKASSDMRQIFIAFKVYTSSGARIRYHPDTFQSMEDFIRILAEKSDLNDAGLFLNYYDAQYFEKDAPQVTGIRNPSGRLDFKPEIMDFPIAFSVAIYLDLNVPAATTPLLWTRGLHHYVEFDEAYGGHITFMDGRVEYYVGEPGKPNPELDAIFGPDSGFSNAVRILEHEPEAWSTVAVAPLPVRYAMAGSVKISQSIAAIAVLCSPALLAAILAALVPKPSIGQRIWTGGIVFGIVLIATLVLVPTS